MTAIAVIARILPRHGQFDHILAAVEKLAEESRRETGCDRYEVYLSAASGQDILIHEIWRSAADLKAHGQTPHVALFKSAISSCAEVEVDKFPQAQRL
ncbi:putative quinol monooxygenase [Sulfitobacter sp. G21635-S1]|uniref:putative quinol monooxygenase n=1 Tax=Sulfitobacter sp. G21635-S1 TaxID=3014043 RepID=UPI0022AE7AAB|nr:putative quinol monooxygenase [Sulfitobacter sp. G21635-S1]MCZ4256736.1 putative quinol monooxygenase [Sulfitobacter sp. G21635-S1]